MTHRPAEWVFLSACARTVGRGVRGPGKDPMGSGLNLPRAGIVEIPGARRQFSSRSQRPSTGGSSRIFEPRRELDSKLGGSISMRGTAVGGTGRLSAAAQPGLSAGRFSRIADMTLRYRADGEGQSNDCGSAAPRWRLQRVRQLHGQLAEPWLPGRQGGSGA